MNLFCIIHRLPIGTKVHLADDGYGVIHEVSGYEWFASGGNVIFKDETKLSMNRLELIKEVIP